MDQLIIAMFGTVAVWLSQDARSTWRRWACVFGLMSQPAWLWASFHAQQWGIFAVSIIYTIAWARGVKNNWMGGSMFGFISRWIKARRDAKEQRCSKNEQHQEIPPFLAKGAEFKPAPPRLTAIRACAEDRAVRSKLPPPTRPAPAMPAVKPARTETRSQDDDILATMMLMQSMSSGSTYVPPARSSDPEPFSGRGGSADGGGASGDWSLCSSSSSDSGGSSSDSSSCSSGD